MKNILMFAVAGKKEQESVICLVEIKHSLIYMLQLLPSKCTQKHIHQLQFFSCLAIQVHKPESLLGNISSSMLSDF